MQKINRYSHAGKSSGEKEAYKNFLSERFKLDKTEEDPENLHKTSSSSFEEDDSLSSNIKSKKKSLKLQVKDFFKNNWVISIVSGVIVLLVGYVFTFVYRQGVQAEKISGVEKRVDNVEEKVDNLGENINSLDKNVNIFKIEYQKDMEYLKNKK